MGSMPNREFSQRADEVPEDLLAALEAELRASGLANRPITFRLDGSEVLLDRTAARKWIKESVDSGFPEVRYHVEAVQADVVNVNLAAFEDPDSQFYE